MSITQEEVSKIAKNLSKLPIPNQSITGSLNNILHYIDVLSEVDTTWVMPTISVIDHKKNSLKEDRISQSIDPNALLWCSPQKVIAHQIAIHNIMS